eukprot:7567336-Pyramimonas_sp.AAC.1
MKAKARDIASSDPQADSFESEPTPKRAKKELADDIVGSRAGHVQASTSPDVPWALLPFWFSWALVSPWVCLGWGAVASATAPISSAHQA